MRGRTGLFLLGCLVAFAASASATPTVICTEDLASGCVGAIVSSAPPLLVASDGEDVFHPFGITVDVSDAIQLNENWALDTGVVGWVQLPGSFTWYLPANLSSIGCGIENETKCEPVGGWHFLPGGQWNADTPLVQYIMDAGRGGISDVITLANDGPGGAATIKFASDPIVPEPGTLALLGLGLAGMAAKRRRAAR